MNEIFRFMVLRPPEAVDPNDNKYVEVKNPQSELQNQLIEARKAENPLEAMVGYIEEFIASDSYVANLDQISTPLKEFGLHLNREDILDVEKLNTIIRRVFDEDAATVVAREDFRQDRQNIADSLIAMVITHQEGSQAYEDMAQALRLCQLLTRVAIHDPTMKMKGVIEEALNAIILLPPGIFPLPYPSSQPTIRPEEQEKIEQARSEHEKAEEKAIRRLENLRTALDELMAVRSSDFRTVEYEPAVRADSQQESVEAKIPDEVVAAPQELSPWILSGEAIQRLSQSTRDEIADIGIALDTLPVTEITQILEERLIATTAEVYKPEQPKDIIRIGSTFLPVSAVLGENPANTVSYTGTIFGAADLSVQEGAFREVGIADLEVVKEEIQRYESGEIAHIENVLRGETKKRTHRRTERTEETYLREEETIEDTEKDLQSTDRFELQKESQQTVSQESSFDVGVTVKYGGFVDVEASTKYATKNANQLSTRSATSYAREATEHTVSRIQERVREQRIRTTIQEIEELNLHKVDNATQPDDHVVGIYRWVDKIYKAQVQNYGKRTMFEFIVPEPAAFTLYAQAKKPPADVTLTEPKQPVRGPWELAKKNNKWHWIKVPAEPLRPQYIHPYNYQQWVAQYQVLDVDPPPAPQITEAHYYKTNAQKNPQNKFARESQGNKIKILDGYKATQGTVRVCVAPQEIPNTGISKEGKLVAVSLQDNYGYVVFTIGTNLLYRFEAQDWIKTFTLTNETQEVPIAVQANHKTSWTATVEVLCQRTNDALDKWRQKTYSAIATAYLNLKSEYDEQLAAASVEEGIAISGRNPKLNREFEKTELKKGALTLLTRKWWPHFKGVGSIRKGYLPSGGETGDEYLEIDLAKANKQMQDIQFLEQAFEWDQMVYVFYPYFWARKDMWPTLQQLDDNDPIHARFLRAGAARVMVPVRLGYEGSVRHYWLVGQPWNGQGPPSVSDKTFLPIIEEIKSQLGNDFTQGKGTLSVTKNNEVVTGSPETNFTEKEDKDREIRVGGNKYRIVAIDDAARKLTLAEKYLGEDNVAANYDISRYRLVGEPWEVKIPTSLVYLKQDKVELPDLTKEK